MHLYDWVSTGLGNDYTSAYVSLRLYQFCHQNLENFDAKSKEQNCWKISEILGK